MPCPSSRSTASCRLVRSSSVSWSTVNVIDADRAARLSPATMADGPYNVELGAMTPMTLDFPVASARADMLRR